MPEAQPSHRQGQPKGVTSQAWPGGGWWRHGEKKKKLAASRGEEDDDAEGGRLAGSHHWPGVGQEGKILGPLVRMFQSSTMVLV